MLHNLQSLRVIFMGLVITAHVEPFFVRLGWIDPAHTIDSLASDGFLLVSAFVLTAAAANAAANPALWLRRRLARLVPLYWAATALVAALALFAPQIFQSTKVTWETAFKSLLFIPYLKHDNIIEPIVFVGWTLNYIVWFAALLALAVAARRAWAIPIVAGVTGALFLIGQILTPSGAVLRFFTDEHVLNLALGAALAGLWGAGEGPAARWLSRTPVAFAIGLIVAGFGLRAGQQVFAPALPGAALAPVLALLIVLGALALERRGHVHRSAIKDRLAEASFSVYLTHYFVTVGAYQVWWRFFGAEVWAAAVFVPGVFLGAAALGLACLNWVERPLDRLVRGPAPAADDRATPKGVSRRSF